MNPILLGCTCTDSAPGTMTCGPCGSWSPARTCSSPSSDAMYTVAYGKRGTDGLPQYTIASAAAPVRAAAARSVQIDTGAQRRRRGGPSVEGLTVGSGEVATATEYASRGARTNVRRDQCALV